MCMVCDVMIGRQAFPIRCCILQAIKNWRRGRPGNEAKFSGTILKVFHSQVRTNNLSVHVYCK